RSDLSDNPTFRELLGRVRAGTLEAFDHQDLPYDRLVEELRPEREVGDQQALFQVLFVYEPEPPRSLAFDGLTWSLRQLPGATALFDLTLTAGWEKAEGRRQKAEGEILPSAFCLLPSEEGLRCGIEYNTDLFEPATIARMAGHFQALLGAV